MPIADVRYRFRELGRLRLGEPGEKAPRKLGTWRLTSPDRTLIVRAAELWGGEPMPWDDAPTEGKQYQITTEASELPVLIPPQDVDASQWFELWTGGGIQRRCDGVTEVTTDGPCLCDPESRDCKPTTHALFLLPDLPDVGVWRLTTRGYYAAGELPQTISLLSQLVHGSQLPAAMLAIETRTSKAGRTTHHFPVPVLRSGATLGQLITEASGAGIGPSATASAGAPALAPGESTDAPPSDGSEARPKDTQRRNSRTNEPASPDTSAPPSSGADRQPSAPERTGEGRDGAGAAPLDEMAFDDLLVRAVEIVGKLSNVVAVVRAEIDPSVKSERDLEHGHLVALIEKKAAA